MSKETFIVSLAVITLSGALGYLLYKYGTDSLGPITFERLGEIRLTGQSIIYLALMLLGFGVVAYSGLELKNDLFIMRYLFTPAILFGLVMLFISRFLIGIPLSITGVGKLTAILTALVVISTAIASNIFFKESFSLKAVAGIALGVISVLLIGEG
jgi:drug/metabolite transporter (DMT)-like permease